MDEQTGAVNVEVKDSNHPDIWSVEGIARALRGFLGIQQPRPLRVSGASRLKVTVDKKVGPIRPYIACA
ncbi:MAG TPA: phenylalanine--tRNA ligase subunit beta, partial [Candidatus Bathyarchaeia archaeon]